VKRKNDRKNRRTFVTKVQSKGQSTTASSCCVHAGCHIFNSIGYAPVGHEGRNTEHEETEAEEKPRSRKCVERLEVAFEDKPDNRGGHVGTSDHIKFLWRLVCLAGEQDDLVRVDRDDLCECEEEGVQRPIANAN